MPNHLQETAASVAASAIQGRFHQVRQMQVEFESRPVQGSFRRLKKLVYQVLRTAFRQQFSMNTATVDLIEAVYRDIESRNSKSISVAPLPTIEKPTPLFDSHLVGGNTGSSGAPAETPLATAQIPDQNDANNIRPLHGFEAVYTAPAQMRMPERVALYSLIYGIQPRNCLEIGTCQGGSSAIICHAMNDMGFGRLTCVDPMPQIAPQLWSQISNRCRLFQGPSPHILQEVARHIDAPFDFALIDGDHAYDGVVRDITGVLPYLADRAYLLFHDAHFPDVQRAIDEAVATNPQLTDCGMVSVESTVLFEHGQKVTWGGLRLLRYQRRMAGAKAA